jgi:hypothetical protein
MERRVYDFTDGTFHFFKVFARRPGATLSLVIWQILLYAVLLIGVVLLFAPFLTPLIEAARTNQELSEAELLAALGQRWAGYAIMVPVLILLLLMVQGAWLRLLTHGKPAAFIPFRIGGDELRLFLVNLVFIVAGYIAFTLLILVTGLAIGALGYLMQDGALPGVVGGLLVTLIAFVAIGFAIFVVLRFAAAPAMTVNEGRFRLFGSVAATKGIWGWMLLSYLVIFVLVLVGSSLIGGIQFVVLLSGMADYITAADLIGQEPDLDELMAMLTQRSVLIGLSIVVGLQLLFQIFVDAAFHGIGAYPAVMHAKGGFEPDEVTAPSGSVGDAPAEG